MNYEEFEARAKSVFDDCSEKKRMLWNMQSIVGTVLDMVRKNERLDRERAELRQENAALKAELDDLKGNAEGFEPDAYMKLPLDADGVPKTHTRRDGRSCVLLQLRSGNRRVQRTELLP